MVTVRVWTRAGEQHITAPTNGAAFDRADELGAYRLVDGVGEVFRRIAGEWVGIGTEKNNPDTGEPEDQAQAQRNAPRLPGM